jgi:hypothetical protein
MTSRGCTSRSPSGVRTTSVHRPAASSKLLDVISAEVQTLSSMAEAYDSNQSAILSFGQ